MQLYRHTENISLDFELNRYILFDENKQKFLNPWLVCILKHRGVQRLSQDHRSACPKFLAL